MDAEHHYAVEDLSPPVEIPVDRWGVPHVYASSAGDAFFVQGRGAARDRLWQIDLWRGTGLLSEAFLYRGEMRRDSSEESPTRIRWSAPARIPRDRRPTSLQET